MTLTSSEYVLDCYKNFSMYVLQTRAFPALADGLKAGGRRLIWTARNGEKYKTATLAGATMPLHPHGDASDTIDTLTKPFCNNYPLFEGIGSFGTRLKPGASGAPRYTSVKLSQFTKDVLLVDLDLVPMVDNYDGTVMEPVHFLPLIPMVLVNPSEGIGVGFSSTILPRAVEDVIDSQIAFLTDKLFFEPSVKFIPFQAESIGNETIKSGNVRWWFQGTFERKDSSRLVVTNLPYGLDHAQFIDHIHSLIDSDVISSVDDHSARDIHIDIKFPRGKLLDMSDGDIIKLLKLKASLVENLNVVDLTGTTVKSLSYCQTIEDFTKWRLTWYLNRYVRQKELLEQTIQRYRDVITAIEKNVGKKGRECESRAGLIEWLEQIKIVNTDYIADLPIYRLTVAEAEKVRAKLSDALEELSRVEKLIADPKARVDVYIKELKAIQTKYRQPKKEPPSESSTPVKKRRVKKPA